VEITRNGEPAAVLMSFSELEALRETIAVLADREAAAQIIEVEATLRLAGSPIWATCTTSWLSDGISLARERPMASQARRAPTSGP